MVIVCYLLQIVYVAPMKALAAEMVRNFGGRLEPLGISVKELTGDMQLSKSEIMKTQVLLLYCIQQLNRKIGVHCLVLCIQCIAN